MSKSSRKKKTTNPYNPPRKIRGKEPWHKHCLFGVAVSLRLLITSLILLINSVIPFFPIPPTFRIHDTSHWLGHKSWSRRQERIQYMRPGR